MMVSSDSGRCCILQRVLEYSVHALAILRIVEQSLKSKQFFEKTQKSFRDGEPHRTHIEIRKLFFQMHKTLHFRNPGQYYNQKFGLDLKSI